MILKVRSCGNPEVWHYFGGITQVSKEMHYDDEIRKATNDMVVREDIYDFTADMLKFSPEDKRDGFLELWLYGKTDEDTKQVLCFKPVYLLNDDGKTVDRF